MSASQADIHAEVCGLSERIVKMRNAKGYGEQAKLQRLRRQRSELQAKLAKPTLAWVNPATALPKS